MSQSIYSPITNTFVYSLYILFILTLDCGALVLKSPALDFNRPSLVQPKVHHGITKRELSSTRGASGDHHSDVQVTVPVDGDDILLDLHLNEDLVSKDHVLQYQRDGKKVLRRPKKEELELCHYSGSIRGRPESRVAVSTCEGIRGIIYDGQTMRYIEPQGPEVQSLHYLYSHKDPNTDSYYDHIGDDSNGTVYPEKSNGYKQSRGIRNKRETSKRVQDPYNANEESRYVELVLVVDHEGFIANGKLRTVHSQMIQVANIINSLYTPLNIYIALVGVVVWNEQNEISIEVNGDTTLANFLKYRKQNLTSDIPNDNAQLLTRKIFSDGVVGKALKGPICTTEFSGGVSSNHSSVIGAIATTIAHAMGHNFGMEHDSEDCECPDEKCIMSPVITSSMPVHWSSCSRSYLELAFSRGMDHCLHNKPERLFHSPTCGNGFIEQGEQCDCGITAAGANACHACCNPDTCMLRRNATCGTGACCDLKTCRLKFAGVPCRTTDRECDLPEFCSGQSEFCPADVHRMDSTPCGVGEDQAYCVRGMCRSHSDQCRVLWGSTGKNSHEKCYDLNTKGNRIGNCGYDPIKSTYTACSSADVLCGRLQCRHFSERLEYGMESVSLLSASFIQSNGSIIPCRTAIVDLGARDVDPGLVPDGAECGSGRMCLKQKCVAVETVRETIKSGESSVCPSDCSGHGVCNSEGHCHCVQGFAPPLCVEPGAGGSVDSGPATNLVRLSSLTLIPGIP